MTGMGSRRHGPLLAGLVVTAVLVPPTEAQETGNSSGDTTDIDMATFILDVEATILDIEATIADQEGGTAVTESSVETTITLEADVFFDFDEYDLRPDAVDTLAKVVRRITGDGATEVHIAGHTDSRGSDEYNQTLSESRAAAVEAFLADRLEGVTVTTSGHGSTQPVAPNKTEDGQDNPEGRALNRRVEITYPQ